MKHRAQRKRRFWPAITAALVIVLSAAGTAAVVGGPGHGAPLGAATVTPAIQHAQVLAALSHRAKLAAKHPQKHKAKHKRKHRHGHSSPSPHPSTTTAPTSPSTGPTSPATGPTKPTTGPASPTATPTPPGTGPGSTSPAPTPTGSRNWAWCSSAAFGTFDTADGFDLYNNEWNSGARPGPQQICGNNGHDWQVTSTQRAGNTEVLTYPSVQKNYPSKAVGSFSAMTSSFAENMHAVAGTDAEAAYDIWINDLSKEVMFWVDNHGQAPAGKKVATVTLGGLTWNLWEEDGYYAFVLDHNATSGTVDLMAGLKYLISRGDLSAGDKLWQVNFGFEVCSTAGAPETFTVSNFTLASS